MNNYFPGENPFGLLPPPKRWLERLAQFDSSLVVFPSCQMHAYRLCQRRPTDLDAKMINSILKDQGDAKVMLEKGLIPVTTIRANPNWDNPFMWVDLAERAPWRNGGAQAVIEHIEKREAEAEQVLNRKIEDMTEQASKEGWNYYNFKRGMRTRLWSPTIKPKNVQPAVAPTIKIK